MTNSLRHLKAIVFDFDGTLCNDFKPLINIINSKSDEFGYTRTPESKVAGLRDLPSHDLFKSLGITPEKLPQAVKNAVTSLAQQIHALPTFPGLADTLHKLQTRNFRLGILTSNSKENVEKFLELNQMKVMDFIYSGSSVFGKHE